MSTTFRGHPACRCLAKWLPVYERMLLKAGIILHNIDIYQLIGGYSGSAGTHLPGGAYDIAQYSPKAVEIARQMGAMAHARLPGWDGANGIGHQHAVLIGCPHNGGGRYQVAAGMDGYNGLGAGGRAGRIVGFVPDHWRTWRTGIRWAKKQLRAKKPKDVLRLRIAECSMQFSDDDAEHRHDVAALFDRGYHVIIGTEAGPGSGNLRLALDKACAKYGYRLAASGRYDTWVAVHRDVIAGGWATGAEHALDRSAKIRPKPPGRWGDKGIVWARWLLPPGFGEFAVGSVHPLTHKGPGEALKDASDKVYAGEMQAWADDLAHDALAIIGGDFNANDRGHDLFRGVAHFLTCWDELRAWPPTHEGGKATIDAIARMLPGKRLRCVAAHARTDKQVFLHTDHRLIESVYEVKPLTR